MCSLWNVNYKHKFIIAIFFLLLADLIDWCLASSEQFFSYKPFLYLFWISSPLNDIKYQLCYLKRCLYTQKFYLFIVTSFLYYYLFFFCVCWNKDITAERFKWICCVPVYCTCMVLILLSFFPRFLLLVIKGQFFTEQKLCFRVHFFSGTQM